MTSQLSNIRRFFILISIVWFAGYASATTVCANSCPDCVAISLSSCNVTCSAVGVPSQELVKVVFTKFAVKSSEYALIYASVNMANIWKPPKYAVLSSANLVI